MSKWTTPNASGKPDFSKLFDEKFAVVLLRGKNSFGDNIYSYVKISFPNFKRMYESMMANETFMPSDFGEVVAAGKGEPNDEVKAEISRLYPLIEQNAAAPAAPAPAPEKKNWDEY